MRPKWSTQGKLKVPEIRITAAPPTHHGAWSHPMSVVLMTRSRKTYWLAYTLERGTAPDLHIGEGALFQAHYTIISRVHVPLFSPKFRSLASISEFSFSR